MYFSKQLILSFLIYSATSIYGQSTGKISDYFSDPIVVDSSSMIIIPTIYNSDFLSSNKISLGGNFYANIVFYDFTTDTYTKLFEKNTFITSFNSNYRYYYNNDKPQNKNITSKHLLYLVSNIDHNQNGKIDGDDPSMLYVSDTRGKELKVLTTENENVVNIDLFEKQNFALIKIQRDSNLDGEYDWKDNSYYFLKLDLTTLTFGNKIETK